MVPGPERTLMEFAYSEMTHNPSRWNGRFVGEGVTVGSLVEVRLAVAERVTVTLGEGKGDGVRVAAAVKVSVAGTDGLGVGGVDVGAPGVGAVGEGINVDKRASRIKIPMRIGMAYLRSRGSQVRGV